MKKQKYDIVYSLGYDCACAQYMQSAQIRICSGPFDWLTNADFQTRLNLILNDFENFLEFDDLKFLPKNQKMFNDPYCDYYENTKNPACNKRIFIILSEIPSVYGNMDVFLYTRRCMYSYTKKGSFRSGHCPGAGIYSGCSEKNYTYCQPDRRGKSI